MHGEAQRRSLLQISFPSQDARSTLRHITPRVVGARAPPEMHRRPSRFQGMSTRARREAAPASAEKIRAASNAHSLRCAFRSQSMLAWPPPSRRLLASSA